MIKVKEINWINESSKEAEVIISDGILTLMCFSQPFNYEVGDELKEPLYCYEVRNVMKSDEEGFISEKQDNAFAYFLRGKLIDSRNKLVMVGGVKISLEDYSIPIDLKDDDIIEFTVQRLDIY